MNKKITKKIIRDRYYYLFLIFIGILFLINPSVGTISMLFLSFIANDKRLAIPSLVIIIMYIWCFQSTRSFNILEYSDWTGGYYIEFCRVPYTSFIKYILVEKEFFWQVYNYIGYYLFGGNFLVFANFTVALTFGLTFTSIYCYWYHSKYELRYFIVSIILFAFLSETQLICNNLLRQQFAFSMMLYVIVRRITTGITRKYYFIAILSIFTHTMTALFIPFLFISINKKFTLKGYLYTLLCFFTLYFLIQFLPLLSSIGFYGAQRLATASEYTGVDVIESKAIYPFLFVMSIYYIKAIFMDKNCDNNRIFFNNFMIILLLLCILMENMPLMQTRYFIIRLFLLPFIIPYFFVKHTIIKNIFMISVSLFFIVRFFTHDYNKLFSIDYFLDLNFFQLNLINLF